MKPGNCDALISRRSLLRRAVAGVAGAGLALELKPLQRIGSSAEAATPDYGPFKMSFQSYSLRHFTEIDDFVREASKLKLSYVELYRGHLPVDALQSIKRVSGKLFLAGYKVAAYGVESFSADHDKNEQLFKFGKMLGVENLSADPSKDAFESLEKLVKAYNIRIAIHNHGPEDKRWQKPEWILASVKNLDPRIGSCADLGHFIRAGINPVEALEMMGPRVLGCHFKDFDKQGKDVVVGTGQLDLVKSLKTLKKIGFKGPLSLEFEGDEKDPVPKMLECLSAIRDAVRQI
jgi:sugar phosphate isomerase/epimerase